MMLIAANKTIAIFGGSAHDHLPTFRAAAVDIGKLLAEQGYPVLLGGRKEGLGKHLADAVTENDGEVHFFIPAPWRGEVDPNHRAQYTICRDLADRKVLFLLNADLFLVLPGTYGTLDQFFHIMARKGAGEIEKPVIVFNIDGYFDALFDFLRAAFHGVDHIDSTARGFHIVDSVAGLSETLSALTKPNPANK